MLSSWLGFWLMINILNSKGERFSVLAFWAVIWYIWTRDVILCWNQMQLYGTGMMGWNEVYSCADGRTFSVIHWTIHFLPLRRMKSWNGPICGYLASKIGEDAVDPPLMEKKHLFLVMPPVGNLDIALLFMVEEVSIFHIAVLSV